MGAMLLNVGEILTCTILQWGDLTWSFIEQPRVDNFSVGPLKRGTQLAALIQLASVRPCFQLIQYLIVYASLMDFVDRDAFLTRKIQIQVLPSWNHHFKRFTGVVWMVIGMVMAFNTTFNNITVVSWRSVLLVEETGKPGVNQRPAANQTHFITQCFIENTPPEWNSNSHRYW